MDRRGDSQEEDASKGTVDAAHVCLCPVGVEESRGQGAWGLGGLKGLVGCPHGGGQETTSCALAVTPVTEWEYTRGTETVRYRVKKDALEWVGWVYVR